MMSTELPFCQTRTPVTLHPIVGLRLGDELLHVAVRNDHEPLARIRRRSRRRRPHPLASRAARITAGTALNLLVGKNPGQGRGLHRERRLELEQLLERPPSGVVSVAGKSSQSRSSAASIGGSPGSG